MNGVPKHIRRIINLQEYCKDKEARSEAGWVNGKVYFRGRYFSQREFDSIFPAVLKYRVVLLDGKQVEH